MILFVKDIEGKAIKIYMLIIFRLTVEKIKYAISTFHFCHRKLKAQKKNRTCTAKSLPNCVAMGILRRTPETQKKGKQKEADKKKETEKRHGGETSETD